MATKPEPAKSTVDVEGKTFQAIELDKGKSYVIALNRNEIPHADAVGLIEALIAQGHTDITAFMVDGKPAETMAFYEVPGEDFEPVSKPE